jgi:hypothetical protein
MMQMVRAKEVDALALPIDCWVVVMQPWHAQYDIIAGERERDEVETIGVRTDDDGGRWNEGSSGLLAPICKSDDVLRRQRHRRDAMLVDERIVDEVASAAAVDEEHSRLASDGATQLDE